MNIVYLIAMSPQEGGGGSGFMGTIIMFALIIFIFYFMIIRPQQKRAKEREKMLTAVKKGDKVVTAAGMHGTVVGLEEKTVLVQVADNVKIKFDKTAISGIIADGVTK